MKHGIKISIAEDNLPVLMTADERKLKQILYNLLSNAVKFSPDGGSVMIAARHLTPGNGDWVTREGKVFSLPVTLEPKSVPENRWVEISVTDSGIGILREDLQRIFDPFEQVESSTSRRYQGTGLGLSLTKKLVDLHGGKIWAESEGVGKGSKFTFVIPA